MSTEGETKCIFPYKINKKEKSQAQKIAMHKPFKEIKESNILCIIFRISKSS
jgi:hypothetical protein